MGCDRAAESRLHGRDAEIGVEHVEYLPHRLDADVGVEHVEHLVGLCVEEVERMGSSSRSSFSACYSLRQGLSILINN